MSDHSIAALIFAAPFLALASIFLVHETAQFVADIKEQKP